MGKNIPNKLRPQQQTFLDEYLETGNAATAYRKAGYVTTRDGVELPWLKEKATQVLLTPSMQGAIVLAKQEVKARQEVTADWVQDKLILAYETALQAEDKVNVLRALELIGKTCNAFTDNLNISTGQLREYTEQERIELKRISSYLLQNKSNIIDIDPETTDASTALVRQ